MNFRKAFDTLSHTYLAELLVHMQVGPRFKNLVMAATTQQIGRLYIDYSLGEPFGMKRGVRQGNPLSPTTFVLALEPLSNELRDKVAGITFDKIIEFNIKVSAYADDMVICLADKRDHVSAGNCLRDFRRISGLEVNPNKTSIMYTSLPETLDNEAIEGQPCGLTADFKYLGVPLSGVDWKQEYPRIIQRIERNFYMDLPMITRAIAFNVYIFSTVS